MDLLIESPPRTVKEDRGGEEELREAHHQKTCVEGLASVPPSGGARLPP